MGGVLAAIAFKSGTEKIQIQSPDKLLWDYELNNIDNQPITLRQIVKGKKAVMFVNVASK